MKRRLKISIALIASLLLSSFPLAAQNATSDWSQVKAVAPGTELEVKLKKGSEIKGRLISVSDTAVSLSVKNKAAEINREDVLRVYQTSKKSATTPTLIGMGIGAGAGAATGAAAGNNNGGFDKIDHAATAALTVLGAGAGALTGYLIGRSGRKKVLIYASK